MGTSRRTFFGISLGGMFAAPDLANDAATLMKDTTIDYGIPAKNPSWINPPMAQQEAEPSFDEIQRRINDYKKYIDEPESERDRDERIISDKTTVRYKNIKSLRSVSNVHKSSMKRKANMDVWKECRRYNNKMELEDFVKRWVKRYPFLNWM